GGAVWNARTTARHTSGASDARSHIAWIRSTRGLSGAISSAVRNGFGRQRGWSDTPEENPAHTERIAYASAIRRSADVELSAWRAQSRAAREPSEPAWSGRPTPAASSCASRQCPYASQ